MTSSESQRPVYSLLGPFVLPLCLTSHRVFVSETSFHCKIHVKLQALFPLCPCLLGVQLGQQHLFVHRSNCMLDFRGFVSFSIPSLNSIASNETFVSKIFSHFLKCEFPFAAVVFLGSLKKPLKQNNYDGPLTL